MQGAQRQYPHCRKKSMKKMNKVAAAVLAVAMVGSMAAPAFAVDAPNGSAADDGKQATAKLTYKVAESYTWEIHSEVVFTQENEVGIGVGKTIEQKKDSTGANNTVHVKSSVLEEGHSLVITVAGNGEDGSATNLFTIKNGENGSKKLSYDVKAGTTAITAPGGTVLTVQPGANEGSVDMAFTLHATNDAAETAGTYTGNVVYTANISK